MSVFAGLVALAVLADDTLDARLDKGEVVVDFETVAGVPQPAIRTVAVLEASPERVFALVDNCAGYAGLLPRVASSTESARDGGTSLCAWTVDLPFPLKDLSTHVAVTSERAPQVFTREFKQTRGDFLRNEGTWRLTPFRGEPNRTRLEYRLLVAIDTIVPSGFVRSGQMGGMNDLVANLRARLEKLRAP